MKLLILAILVVLGALALNPGWQGLKPAILPLTPQPTKTLTSSNSTGLPLNILPGFSIQYAAAGLNCPRDLEFDPGGTLIASIPCQNKVVSLTPTEIGLVASGLNQPHGIAYANGKLYIAQADKVTVDGKKILDLPTGGNHTTRSILIKDGKIYVSMGSSCNVCYEKDPRRAAIWVAALDGSDFKPFATGLRNSVFLIEHQGEIWATDMGRDHLGNNLPPEEVNIIKEGDYGWPGCYGKNIHDTNFDKNQYIRDPCAGKIPPEIEMPAHFAPLGLAFVPASWPAEYRGKLLVAFHGSWNRNPPDGYKIVSIDPATKKISDFITGWLQPDNSALGRPADLIFDSAGNLYVSDDKRGVVYKITPPAPAP